MSDTILIVDDEPSILSSLSAVLKDAGFSVLSAQDGPEALRLLRQEIPRLVLLDIWMPDQDGLETLKKIRELYPQMLVVMMSGHGSIETAVKATKLGAYDYIEKPLSLEKVTLVIKHAIHEQRLEEENLRLRAKVGRQLTLVGESPSMKRLQEIIRTAGPSNSRVLISGENGTGKELVAHAIHRHSLRADQPFVEVNCAAIPETLIESELFGYEKGAFTGAVTMKQGRFELAHGGTLFLDEIGDMSLPTQAKVLRVLQEQHFQRVGGTKLIEVDVRVIAASNKNLQDEIKKGNFREDLFYRLNVIPIHVQPLRERKEDIPRLARHFISLTAEEQGLKPKEITEEALDLLIHHDWPGNVRELRNMVERLMILVPRPLIGAYDLEPVLENQIPAEPINSSKLSNRLSLRQARAVFEKELISRRLKENDWNISKTAEDLQIERSHLHRKIKLLGIEVKPEND
jgi:two-component system, NtrC family, nitrogen regulation response regulator NtrX